MRVIFAGSADFSAAVMKALLQSNHRLVALLTHPDKKAKRGQAVHYSACKELALANDIPIIQSANVNEDSVIEQVLALKPDVMVVSAFGQIINEKLIQLPRLGCINTHASLLPKYRGASPIQAAILNGESETGVSMMRIVHKLDAGDVARVEKCPVTEDETMGSLELKLMALASKLTLETLALLSQGELQFTPQHHEKASYCKKITKQDAKLNFEEGAVLVDRKIRAYHPSPVAHCQLNLANYSILMKIHQAKLISTEAVADLFPDSSIKSLKAGAILYTKKRLLVCIHQKGCVDGFIEIKQIQLPNKSVISAANLIGSTLAQFRKSEPELSQEGIFLN